jgi:transcriptional regulator with XRE-family HTH domain
MIEPRQIRAARALLNWSQDDLASASGIARSSIKNIENDITIARRDTIHDIQVSLENCGVEFLPGSGVRIKSDFVSHLSGADTFLKILDDVILTLRTANNAEALFSCVVDGISPPEVIESYRYMRSQKIKMRSLIKEDDTALYGDLSEYRCLPKKFFHNSAQIIYHDKIATMLLDEATGSDKGAIIVRNAPLAAAQKNLFEFIWAQCPQPELTTATLKY